LAVFREALYAAAVLVNLPAMRLLSGLLSVVAAGFAAGTLWAGGSGLNVIIVLATTNLSRAFQRVTSLVASNTVILWAIPAPAATPSFYRVRLGP